MEVGFFKYYRDTVILTFIGVLIGEISPMIIMQFLIPLASILLILYAFPRISGERSGS